MFLTNKRLKIDFPLLEGEKEKKKTDPAGTERNHYKTDLSHVLWHVQDKVLLWKRLETKWNPLA